MSDSTTYRNVVYRLSPGDAATANLLLGIWDGCRFTWNEVKAAREIQYEHACGRKIESPTFFTLGTAFKTLWDQTEWLRKHSHTIVRYTLRYQADAWTAFFEGRAGYPKWKHRYSGPSFTIPEYIRIRDGKLAVPKVGWLSIRRRGGNPHSAGRPVKAVIRRIGHWWEVVVCYEVPAPQQNDNGRFIGVDRNAGQVADSDGAIHRMRPGTAGNQTQATSTRPGEEAQGVAAARAAAYACTTRTEAIRQRAQELAAPRIQAHRRKGPDRRRRETEHQGHDEECQGNDRQARHECAPEGRP